MIESKLNQPKEFNKLLKLHTDEAHKAYVKAQKNYLSVLKRFVKQKIASGNDYQKRYEVSVVCCLENQWEPDWAYFKDLNNEIKVLLGMIGDYEFDLLNSEQFEEELN
jgi:hypothetical protein